MSCLKCGYDESAEVVASWTFHVDRDPPSLNSRLFNAGTRRWAYKRERDAWCLEFRAIKLMQRLETAKTKRRVTLTRVYAGRQKLRDRDNLAGGMKGCVDALVLEGLLVDDSNAFAEIHYEQLQGGPVGLRVQIEVLA